MDVSDETQSPGHFTAREGAVIFIELEAGWALELDWMFWRRVSCLAPAKI
jgi:hypothetical protein